MDPNRSGLLGSGGLHHTPMSERQRLALIKRLEKQAAATQNQHQGQTDNGSSLVSPPRTPLQVVNGPSSNNGNSSTVNMIGSGAIVNVTNGPNSTGTSSSSTNSSNVVSPARTKKLGLQGSPRSPAIDRLLKKISKKNGKGETALHTAAIKGSRRIVRTLLQLGANPNAQDNAEWSPLHEACNRGNYSVVKLLHEFGADINLRGFAKDSPLHDAARNGHIKVVKYLTRCGADLTARNAAGRSPREEAELVSLRCVNDDLKKTVDYLTGHEKDDFDQGQSEDRKRLLTSDESDHTDSDVSGDENDDVARFLGVTKSPGVQQAFQSLGISSSYLLDGSPKTPSSTAVKSRSSTPTSSRRVSKRENRIRIEKVENDVGDVDILDKTPTGVNHQTHFPSLVSKIRLTYGMENKTSDVATSVKPAKAEDPYEFNSSSSKEPATEPTNENKTSTKVEKTEKEDNKKVAEVKPAPDKPSTSVVTSSTPTTSVITTSSSAVIGEKRSVENEAAEEEDSKKKKPRKEEQKELIQSASSSSAVTAAPPVTGKPGRSTRGSSSEKATGAKTGGKNKGQNPDRKSPSSLAGSAANSPKKPQSRDHSDNENEDDSSKKEKESSGLKVPPLKIVLSGSSNGSGNGTISGTTQAISNTLSSNNTGSGGTPLDEQSKKGSVAVSASKDENEVVETKADESLPDQASTSDAATSDAKTAASSAAAAASRITRSRANQGTPGPDESQSDGATSADSSSGPQGSSSTATHSNTADREKQTSAYDYNVKKRKLRSQVDESNGGASAGGSNGYSGGNTSGGNSGSVHASGQSMAGLAKNATFGGGNGSGNGGGSSSEPLNDIEKFLNIRKQVEQRRKNLFPVQPKPPEGFKDYLMNRKTYLLQQNAAERLRSLPMIQPPHSLDGPLRQLFKEQEQERYKLRMKHVVEKEKLVLAVEQEILRVHGRAARALANQSLPFSVCTILRDEEIYTPIDPELEEKNRDIRSRYNGRLFLSWLQDVDDKWEKIKEQMVLRHHNEAESLNAVQKMDWEWKVSEMNLGAQQGTSQNPVAQVDDLHIPMVHVSDDFDLADCRQ